MSHAGAKFHSILFERPESEVRGADEPDVFRDLNLDQVVATLITGRGEYDLASLFSTPLHDVATVGYRHEIVRDLENETIAETIGDFSRTMSRMRSHLVQVEKLHYQHQKERWFLDGVADYCDAIASLRDDLGPLPIISRGLRAFRSYVADYVESETFRRLAVEARQIIADLEEVPYTVHIRDSRVRVADCAGEADYSAEIEQTFAKFRQGAVEDHLVKLRSSLDMDHVEAQVLDRVARLNPETFRTFDDFCARHRDFLDDTIVRFDREVQFYRAYLELIEPLEKAGLSFCYPDLSDRPAGVHAEAAFDLALAGKLVAEDAEVVCNDIHLEDPERILVVTGPNQGGKTTYARTFGQLHYLASLGLPVPARSAHLPLPDRVFTHFEREESLDTLRGKLEDELVRVHDLLERATGDSVVVMNESFTSTTLNDALLIGTDVLRRLIDRGVLGVYVTFVDELASLDEATVSMVATVVPDDPAERTYEIVRKPADGLAYASAIAEKYGLTYSTLRRRVAP